MQQIALWVSLIFLSWSFQVQGDSFQWESQLEHYFENEKTSYLTQFRFYTYLYASQNDAAMYPSPVQEYVTEVLIKRFFPDFTDFQTLKSDPYLENLANQILCPYLARLKLEETNTHTYPSNCWLKESPEVVKWISWSSPLPQPPPPIVPNDCEAWADQLNQLKIIRQNLTQEQRKTIEAWVGHHGKDYEWRIMANRYMQEQQIPFAKVLLVRSVLMKGIYDGIIAEMEAKYTYCVPRPYMRDPAFKPLIPKLQTPSYPSGHAIQGAIFAGILSYFFPESSSHWYHLDEEGANTRLWEGVHFPEDIKQGRILGQQIALQTLKKNINLADSERCPCAQAE